MAAACAAAAVAIIGAGPSGLAACKAALEEGLVPLVLEQADGVGGLWRQDSYGKVWRSLRTNLSKFTCAFSDFPWPEEAADFPTGKDVQDYLDKYASRFNLLEYINFASRVMDIEPVSDGTEGWKVSWQQKGTNGIMTQQFKFLIVATGIFEVAYKPNFPGEATFRGQIVHAATYREPATFAGKKVLVVGSAFSGADIAAEVSSVASKVVISAQRSIWYLPRYIKSKPADLVFYSRAAAARSAAKSEEERNAGRHDFFRTLSSGDSGLPAMVPTPDPGKGDLPFVALTDSFLDHVRGGKVHVRAVAVEDVVEEDAVFADGSRESFDIVLMATGYRLDLPFFSAEVKAQLEFDGNDLLQPLILQESVWRPELKNLAFVGVYRGPYFAVMELQARWAAGVFSGRLPQTFAESAAEALEAERQIRNRHPRPQFPHGDYVGMADGLARRVGVYPEELLAADSTSELQHLLVDGPLLPFHYRLAGFGAAKETATDAIKHCDVRFPIG